MAQVSISRRYARALLEVGIESGQADAILGELEQLVDEIHASKALVALIESPVFARSERRRVIDALAERMKLSKTTHDFLKLLVDRERTPLLPEMVRIYRDLADEAANRVRATVTTPMPLTDAEATGLEKALESATGKTVTLGRAEDPTLLGGLVATVGDKTFDASLKTQLALLKQAALER